MRWFLWLPVSVLSGLVGLFFSIQLIGISIPVHLGVMFVDYGSAGSLTVSTQDIVIQILATLAFITLSIESWRLGFMKKPD